MWLDLECRVLVRHFFYKFLLANGSKWMLLCRGEQGCDEGQGDCDGVLLERIIGR